MLILERVFAAVVVATLTILIDNIALADKCEEGPKSVVNGGFKVEISADGQTARFFMNMQEGWKEQYQAKLPETIKGCGSLFVEGYTLFFLNNEGLTANDNRRLIYYRHPHTAGAQPISKVYGFEALGIDPAGLERSVSHTPWDTGARMESGTLKIGSIRLSIDDGSIVERKLALPDDVTECVEEGPSTLATLREMVRKDPQNERAKQAVAWLEAQEKEIRQWIAKLGDPSPDVRKEAREELIRTGRPAVALLEKARKGKDLRIAVEAEELLGGTLKRNGAVDGVKIVRVWAREPYRLKKTGQFVFTTKEELVEIFEEIPSQLQEVDFSRWMVAAYLGGHKSFPAGMGRCGTGLTFFTYNGFVVNGDTLGFSVSLGNDEYDIKNCVILLNKTRLSVRFDVSQNQRYWGK